MDRMLTIGSTGSDVSELQALLNRSPPTQFPPLKIDNIFGPKTSARVKEFQRNNGLQIDGIVGPKTLTKLRALQPQVASRTGVLCDNSDPANLGKALTVRNALVSSLTPPGGQLQLASFGQPKLLGLPSLRSLTVFQIATATKMYGTSLDFPRIFISSLSGAGGRAFTIAVISPTLEIIQIMNCGTFNPDDNTLIHELAHAWQSQHHSDPVQFMRNAVGSQALAVALNASSFSVSAFFPFDAYASVPGPVFENFAAEQIATQVDKGIADTVRHVSSVGRNVVDSKNVASLSKTRAGFVNAPGSIR